MRALNSMMLPDASLGGGGNGDGSLVAHAVVVNTEDKPLDVPAGRARVRTATTDISQRIYFQRICGDSRHRNRFEPPPEA